MAPQMKTSASSGAGLRSLVYNRNPRARTSCLSLVQISERSPSAQRDASIPWTTNSLRAGGTKMHRYSAAYLGIGLLVSFYAPVHAACSPSVVSQAGTTQTCFSPPNNVLYRYDGDIYIELSDANATICQRSTVPESHGSAQIFYRLKSSNINFPRISAAAELTLMSRLSLALILRADASGACEILDAYHGGPGGE